MMNNAKNTTYVVGILPRVSIVRPNHVVGWLQGKMGRKGHFLTCAELCEVMYVFRTRLSTRHVPILDNRPRLSTRGICKIVAPFGKDSWAPITIDRDEPLACKLP